MSVSSFPSAIMVAGLFKVTVSGETVSATQAFSSQAGIEFLADGTVDKNENGVRSQVDSATDWVIPNDSSSPFEVRATLNSGDTPSGTLGSWLALTTDRAWALTAGIEVLTCNLTIEVRLGSTVLDSGTYVLTAEGT